MSNSITPGASKIKALILVWTLVLISRFYYSIKTFVIAFLKFCAAEHKIERCVCVDSDHSHTKETIFLLLAWPDFGAPAHKKRAGERRD